MKRYYTEIYINQEISGIVPGFSCDFLEYDKAVVECESLESFKKHIFKRICDSDQLNKFEMRVEVPEFSNSVDVLIRIKTDVGVQFEVSLLRIYCVEISNTFVCHERE